MYIIEKFHHEVEVRITRQSILDTLMEIKLTSKSFVLTSWNFFRE